MNYYSHHIGDYRRDTAHLSLLEHGVYRQLLDMYYLSESRIPDETDVVYRRLCARTDEEKRAVDTVLSEFFRHEEGWVHTRCEKEISEYQGKADRARSNGKLGGRPSKTKEVISGNQNNTDAKANQEPLTTNQEPVTKDIPVASAPAAPAAKTEYDPLFLIAWAAYPRREGSSKKDAFKAWKARIKAGVDPVVIAEGLDRYIAYCKANKTEPRFIKTAETFFGPGEHYLGEWPCKPTALQRVVTDLSNQNYQHYDDNTF